ncbi:SPX-domain-containing protein [Obba rivulosa]|uniref:SPX-domain-containing protein n=1 Tax=Obba rivulosa TaxID=1052685 RepID=A0A8E2AW15_9APHY|nr:SPX-domain-containing protein [Obba rivulosa]
MKFARYLEETQTPEWKKAYIDYRGLKKRIAAIRRAQESGPPDTSRRSLLPLQLDQSSSSEQDVTDPEAHVRFAEATSHESLPTVQDSALDTTGDADRPPVHPNIRHSHSTSMQAGMGGIFPRLRRRSTARTARSVITMNSAPAGELPVAEAAPPSSVGSRRTTLDWDGRTPIPLMNLIPLLPPVHSAFFEKLDHELEKVETFYCQREKEAKERTAALKQQLQELQDHRRTYYEAHPTSSSRPAWISILSLRRRLPKLPPAVFQERKQSQAPATVMPKAALEGKSRVELEEAPTMQSDEARLSEVRSEVTQINEEDVQPFSKTRSRETGKDRRAGTESRRASLDTAQGATLPKHDPEEYQHAKKKLKRAVLECYRGLEVLNNYRTLNLIGFRKALKKYEKVTRVPAQEAYTREKIEPSAFASGATVESMLREMELLFAARFTRGDKKKALTRLRGTAQRQTHHFSTFCAGLLLGLAVPAFVSGIYQSKGAAIHNLQYGI